MCWRQHQYRAILESMEHHPSAGTAANPKSGPGALQRLAAWLHARVEPLCTLREIAADARVFSPVDGTDMGTTREVLARYYVAAGLAPDAAVKLAASLPWEQREYLKANPIVVSEHVLELTRGEKKWTNHIGIAAWKLFSYGTECGCCWGYRVLAVAFAWFVVGIVVARTLAA